MEFRIGQGYDVHALAEGLPMWLGGVQIPSQTGFVAHSDGDVLIHAVIDALLGAAALGDIGSHFPDTDDRWKGADSGELLRSVVYELRGAGYSIENIDVTVICERPKLRPFVELIRSSLADLMSIGIGRISVKGKTNEGMDAVGAGKGIAVHAVALLR